MKGRVLLAKPGLDGHESGVLLVARALSEAGFEVIYLGLRCTPTMIADAAVSEDVDLVGLSVLTGGHLVHARAVLAALARRQADDLSLVVGGIIPKPAAAALKEIGVAATFGPGESLTSIVATVEKLCDRDRMSTP